MHNPSYVRTEEEQRRLARAIGHFAIHLSGKGRVIIDEYTYPSAGERRWRWFTGLLLVTASTASFVMSCICLVLHSTLMYRLYDEGVLSFLSWWRIGIGYLPILITFVHWIGTAVLISRWADGWEKRVWMV